MGDDDIVGIARLILGATKELPEWLVPVIGKALATLAWSVKTEPKYPSREELRKRLQALSAAIENVRKEIRDLSLSTLLLRGDDQFHNENEMYHGLGDLAVRVTGTIDRIPSRKGRDKFFGRPEGLTLQVNCALMVSTIWVRVHGKSPPNTAKSAQQACAALWEAAGGEILGRWGKTAHGASVVVWRDHLREAKRSADSAEAAFILRSLSAE
jgi:hypothetical protein